MQIYSPEQSLNHPLYIEKQVKVVIKRDDMIHPFISGNKWRKLKYNLLEAKKLGKKKLVTFGGAWSNHLLATSCAGATYGYKVQVFVRGDEVRNPVLTMCTMFGAELIFTDRTAYKDKRSLFNSLEDREECYFIDEGGAGLEATIGCEELVSELETIYDHVFCAAGTGTTVAGIAKGISVNNLPTILNVVPVLKGGGFIADEMSNLGAVLKQTQLHLDYHFGGYAKTNAILIDFIKEFITQTGVMIEPTYTGKVFYALHDLISKDYFPVGSKILIVHTGGLTGLLGMLDKF